MKIKILDTDIYYEKVGEGIPVLIIPGLFINSKSMKPAIEPVLEPLEKYQRIYIDMPGMGNTPKHSMENTTESMVKILEQFVYEVVGRQPLIILGYSYGGYLGTCLARHLGSQVMGEVRICAVVNAWMKDRHLPMKVVKKQDDVFFNQLDEKQQENAIKNLVIINKDIHKRYESEIFKELSNVDRKFLLDLFFNGYQYQSLEADRVNVEYPVVFIIGNQDDICGTIDTISIIEYYKEPTLHIINEAGHNLHIEHAQLFNALITNWFKDNF